MMPVEHSPLAHAQQSELVKFTSCILVRLQLWGTAAGQQQLHLEAPSNGCSRNNEGGQMDARRTNRIGLLHAEVGGRGAG